MKMSRPRQDRRITASALPLNRQAAFDLEELAPVSGRPRWIDYIKGVCWALREAGYPVPGADLKIRSSIPIGSGLSSSAALEVGVAVALNALSGTELPLLETALLCQKAENQYVGVRCGIMDQMAVALGREGHALLIDCRSLEYSHIPFSPEGCRLLIVDSRVQRSLGASEYNRRREECEEALEQLAKITGRSFPSLREVKPEDLREAEGRLPELLFRRSRYVVEENRRVEDSARALRAGDYAAFGELMKGSHLGLRDLYQVSCAELDLIVETALAVPGVLGARMTGAGFGAVPLSWLKAPSEESRPDPAPSSGGLAGTPILFHRRRSGSDGADSGVARVLPDPLPGVAIIVCRSL